MSFDLISLHLHSWYSDGEHSPETVIRMFDKYGSKVEDMEGMRLKHKICALTDHDTFQGIPEAKEAADMVGIDLIPGIELTTRFHEQMAHVIGLYPWDSFNTGIPLEVLGFRCDDAIRYRNERAVGLVDRLAADGFRITREGLYEKSGKGIPSRIHIAAALYDNGHGDSVLDARDTILRNYLPSDLPQNYYALPDLQTAVRMITQTGGVAVLPHVDELPIAKNIQLTELLIDSLINEGLKGIEMKDRYSTSMAKMIESKLRDHQLLRSVGSDWHGATYKPHLKIGIIDTGFTVEDLCRFNLYSGCL